MRILVVEDELALAENMAEVLATVGHRAEIATSAEEALVRLRVDASGADVLLTDFRLPGANGADLVRALRSLGNMIPALVITAYRDRAVEEASRGAGAAGILEKPVDLDRLFFWIGTIEEHVRSG